jgi:hypothetical protein
VGKALARWLVESGHGGRHSRPLPLSILSGPGHFRRYSCWRNLVFIARLWLSSVESPAGCWRSRPFSWSRSSLLDTVETPGMPAGRPRCPWHTPEVIPTTLAPETGEASWVCMGLQRVPVLAKVLLVSVKVPGVRRPAWKLMFSRSGLAELHRPPRDVLVPRPIRLETAVLP